MGIETVKSCVNEVAWIIIATSSLYGDWNHPDYIDKEPQPLQLPRYMGIETTDVEDIFIVANGIATSSLYGDWNRLAEIRQELR